MTVDLAALLAPISEAAPGGADAHDTPEYEIVSTEIDALTNPLAGRQPDWAKVDEQGCIILAKQSKDFMVAAWVCAAWNERSGLATLADAAQLLAGLVQDFWQTGFPGLKRIRGRRNAIEWWMARVTVWLDATTLAPIEKALQTKILDALSEADGALAEADPEAPPLRDLIQRVQRLDVIEPAAQQPAADPVNDTGSVATTAQTETKAQTVPASGPAAPAPVANQSSTSMGFANLANVTSPTGLATALEPVMQYLGQASQKLLELEPFNPMIIQLSRFGARGMLLSLPETPQGGVTRLPAPQAVEISSFQTICAAGNPQAIIAFCEGRIATYPFWLDLDRQSALAYGASGVQAAGMRAAVVETALIFVGRLPGLELLSFANNLPFASDETRAWLKACQDERQSGVASDAFGKIQKEGQDAVNTGEADTAFQIYQDYASGTASGREQFRARLAMAQLTLSLRKEIDVVALIEPLTDDCDRLGIAFWDPDLALSAWVLKLKALKQAMTLAVNTQAPARMGQLETLADQALKRIAGIDSRAALRLV